MHNLTPSSDQDLTDLSVPLQVDEVDAGGEAHRLPLPLVQVLHGRHGVEHLVADDLLSERHGLPPNLVLRKYFLLKSLSCRAVFIFHTIDINGLPSVEYQREVEKCSLSAHKLPDSAS